MYRSVKQCPVTGPLGRISVVSAGGHSPAAAHGRARVCQRSKSSRPEYAPANGFANETARDRETTRDTGDAQRGLRLVSETRRNTGDRGDVRRGAHNPEVAGSNPAPPLPSLQVRGLFRSWKGPSACCRVHGIVHEASEEGRRGGWAVRRTPRTSFATQATDGLPLRRGARTSAINCR